MTYVTGDLAGQIESPVYAILRDEPGDRALALPEGYGLEVFNATQPFDTSRYAMKWDGEWHITYRGVPRSRPRLRRGAGAHLRAGGRLVPVVRRRR